MPRPRARSAISSVPIASASRPRPSGPRRRTPGLRREEVAARAHVSVAWYTWLEQGRGGPPSAEVLERLARALELDAAGREMLFLLAQQRPPPRHPDAHRFDASASAVPAPVQRMLDGMPYSPAIVKTPTWDIVAWNTAARAVLTDYAALPVGERNVLRRMFSEPAAHARLPHLEENARWALAVFRIDVARVGGSALATANALAAELSATSEVFRRYWAESDVAHPGNGLKRLVHPQVGPISLEYSALTIDGLSDLSLLVFTPVSECDTRAVATLIEQGGFGVS